MTARKKPTTIQLEPTLLVQIDQAAKTAGLSRQAWIASACANTLGITTVGSSAGYTTVSTVAPVAPSRWRSSSEAKQGVEPRPKGKS